VHRDIKKSLTMKNYRIIEIFYTRQSKQQNNRSELYTHAVKLSHFSVISKEIIVTLIS